MNNRLFQPFRLVACFLLILGGIGGFNWVQAEKENPEDPSGSEKAVESAEAPLVPSDEATSDSAEAPVEDYGGLVVRIPVDESTIMNKTAVDFTVKTLRKAQLDGASAIILDMDTPGGRIDYTEEILETLENVEILTITFVNPAATSAGSILALGTDTIYMRSVATIGSALAVMMTGDIEGDMKSKVDSKQIALVRNLAIQNGHNPDIAEAFVSRNKKVRIGDEVIHEEGEVLNLNSIDATRVIDGKPVFAKAIANSIDEILEAEKITGDVITPEPIGMEAFAFWVRSISAILIGVGVAGAWIEMQMPGFSLPGIVSVCAFGLFLFGNYMAGNLAGYGSAVAIGFGLILIALEVLVFPGTFVSGIVGMCFIIGGIVTAMIDKVDFEWFRRGNDSSFSITDLIGSALVTTSFALLGGVVVTIALMRYLPDSKLASPIILKSAVPGMESEATTGDPIATRVGQTGETTTDLRPAGKARIDGLLIDVTSDGEWVEKGKAVRVVQHEGSHIVVRPA